MWRGKPIFIRHRSKEEIDSASKVSIESLKHKASDDSRVENPKWLVVIGVCTHLGCVPLGQKIGDSKGNMEDGFVHVMDRIMTRLEESGKARLH